MGLDFAVGTMMEIVMGRARQDKGGRSLDLGGMPAVELQADTVAEMDNLENHLSTVRIRAHRLGVVLRDRSVVLRVGVLASLEVEVPHPATYLFCLLFP
jgi:hypothetical protein